MLCNYVHDGFVHKSFTQFPLSSHFVINVLNAEAKKPPDSTIDEKFHLHEYLIETLISNSP